jgi:hypothetical protein
MANTPVQKGVQFKIGFGGLAYTGYLPEDGTTNENDAEQDIIRDEDNATCTVMLSDPKQVINVAFLIKETGGSITAPTKGNTITISPPGGGSTKYRCESAKVTHSRKATRLEMTLVKEVSMTYV